MAFVALAAIPIGAWITRPRPLSAAFPQGFTTQIRDYRQEEILSQMCNRFEGMSFNFSGPDPGTDPTVRWHEIQSSIQQAGAEPNEALEVVRAAQIELAQEWPCLAERGYLRGQPVWLVAGSSPHDTGFTAWICPPSAEDIRRERTNKYCTNVKVAVISAETPHQVFH